MRTLLCLGLGYCAQRLIALHGDLFARRLATSRDGTARGGVETLRFDGTASPELVDAARTADVVLATAAPGEAGDPFLGPLGDALAAAQGRGTLIYLSTIGVYGDHAGGWVDESTPPQATLERTRMRVAAEQAWTEVTHGDAAVLRLAGIYGPGRNALATLRAGNARRIIKPGQVFNRIHVDDIARAIMAAIHRHGGGIWNVCDDEPAPPQDVISYAAKLMGVAPPPEEAFATAEMSAMARSFYAGSARVSNANLKRELGVTLAYPTYRHGLDALWRAGEGR